MQPGYTLVIASESGEIAAFDLSEVRSVKLLEDGTRRDINEFANATASTRRRDAKTITVTSNGTGTREMVVSYTVAAPIWKTTYRVVLDEQGKPFFQGWAIIDNVGEEDWNSVQMSLVSGSPISFIQNLQKPLYRYRPIIPIPEDLNLRPADIRPGKRRGLWYGKRQRFGLRLWQRIRGRHGRSSAPCTKADVRRREQQFHDLKRICRHGCKRRSNERKRRHPDGRKRNGDRRSV